ncbi:MAG TPA: hypothetical protein VGU20_26065 [Stellaceae bacterium]|nr:hypothetical protein [Stellaceae bacterium]
MSASSSVVRLSDYREPPKHRRQKSQYELYPLPFFNADTLSTWDVRPTGNYAADCKAGQAYAIEFLKSCDGTNGWAALLQNIVADMIRVGPEGIWPDGAARLNGIVIGFMGTIGRALSASQLTEQ